MNMDMRIMQERVKQDPLYIKMFEEAGMGEPSNGKVRKLIPEYLKTLTSRNVPYDQGRMDGPAKRGEELFAGKAGCVQCHSGPLFSDGQAHNLGVPENRDIYREPLRHITFVAFNMFMGNENYMNLRRDPGAHVITHYAEEYTNPPRILCLFFFTRPTPGPPPKNVTPPGNYCNPT